MNYFSRLIGNPKITMKSHFATTPGEDKWSIEKPI
jgi:hypothetical protein